MLKSCQKGISLYITVIILSIILAMALGLTAILISQIQMTKGMGYSVVAIYAADTGVEEALKDIFAGIYKSDYPPTGTTQLENKSEYQAKVVCCEIGIGDCSLIDCPVGLSTDTNCTAEAFCVWSVGTYREVKRAIEVKVAPPNP